MNHYSYMWNLVQQQNIDIHMHHHHRLHHHHHHQFHRHHYHYHHHHLWCYNSPSSGLHKQPSPSLSSKADNQGLIPTTLASLFISSNHFVLGLPGFIQPSTLASSSLQFAFCSLVGQCLPTAVVYFLYTHTYIHIYIYVYITV